MNMIYQPMSLKSWLRVLFLVVLCYGSGLIVASFNTPAAMAWYHGLYLAPLTPPDWLFGLVWFVLYGLMAGSAFLVWTVASHRYFYFQLIAMVLWGYTFWEAHMTFWSFCILVALTLFVSEMIKEFHRYSKLAARLLVPYLLWVVFASYLNAYVFMYN